MIRQQLSFIAPIASLEIATRSVLSVLTSSKHNIKNLPADEEEEMVEVEVISALAQPLAGGLARVLARLL
ncbi:MAG: hypothetical protein VYD19_09615, partial [Myxococcota bacterium]|nr:hypothetical protein [Myxococcota bacterium]